MEQETHCIFSILMCVYNRIDLLDHAIRSLTDQNETSWELLILDNSDRNQAVTWEALKRYARQDGRIHIFQNSKNEGWAKGTAILLSHASGEYMSFLAADDFLLSDALSRVRKEIDSEHPDIVWVGNGFYQYADRKMEKTGQSVTLDLIRLFEKNAVNIKTVAEHVFFNSMFHYTKISFLKKNQIDFYEPYYGDCVGMTKAMTEAEKMSVINSEIYGLVSNTSQTRGRYIWDCEEHIFVPWWECIKAAYVRDRYFNFQDIRYCAIMVIRGHIGYMDIVLGDCACIDKTMNTVFCSLKERFRQLKKALEHPIMQEMVQLYGRFEYEEKILGSVITFCKKDIEEFLDILRDSGGWLGRLIELSIDMEHMDTEEVIKSFQTVLLDVCNSGMMGMGMFLQYVNVITDTELVSNRKQIHAILERYEHWKNKFVGSLYEQFQGKQMLQGQSRVEFAACCKYILEN